MDEHTLSQIRAEIKRTYPPYGTHGYEHTFRVYEACLHIGRFENADLSILLPAALLHDIAREEENHAKVGAERSKQVLRRYGYSVKKVEAISKAISTHSFSGNKPPKTLEAKILSDADKLDALGATGIYRTAVYSGEHARPVEDFVAHFHEKLLKLEEFLFTDEAKRMAIDRTRFMEEFLEQFDRELKQEV